MVTKPISQNVTISDESGQYRLKVEADGSINVNGGGGGGSNVDVTSIGGNAVLEGVLGAMPSYIVDGTGTAITYNANGQATMANSSPVVIASNQTAVPASIADGSDVSLGATTDAAVAAGATGSVQAKLRRISSSQLPAALGIAARSASTPVVIADINAGEYETVAASQTAQVLGATGATGDYISGLLVIPATTSPGNVLLLDNATSITVFTGGATSVSNLVPFFIPLGMYSVSGAWKVTTGANVSVIGIGNFT